MAVVGRSLQDEMWSGVSAAVRLYSSASSGHSEGVLSVRESAGNRIACVEEVNGFGEDTHSLIPVVASHWPWVEAPS